MHAPIDAQTERAATIRILLGPAAWAVAMLLALVSPRLAYAVFYVVLIGYVVAAEPWMTGMRKCLLYSTNGVSTPSQWAALAAFELPADFYETTRRAYRERRDLLVSGLCELGLACEAPHGAFYAFPDVSHINPDSRAAADRLLERAQVATVPGVVFGEHGEGHLRFSFSTSVETIQAGLDSMRRNL